MHSHSLCSRDLPALSPPVSTSIVDKGVMEVVTKGLAAGLDKYAADRSSSLSFLLLFLFGTSVLASGVSCSCIC